MNILYVIALSIGYTSFGENLVDKNIALIPIATLILVLLATLLFGVSEAVVFDPPYLYLILNSIFWIIAILAIGMVSSKSFMQNGSLSVLLVSNSIFIFALNSVIVGYVVTYSVNWAVAIGVISVDVAAILQLIGGILAFKGKGEVDEKRKVVLAVSYISSLAFVSIISILSLSGLLPTFFSSTGPTLIRQVFVGLNAFFFSVATSFFAIAFFRSKSTSLFWYTLAVLLVTIGIFAAFGTKAVGDIPTWITRIAFYIGAIYLTIAVFKSRKSDSTVYDVWAEAFRGSREQFTALFSNMLDSLIYCKILVDRDGKPVNWVFLDVNDSYARLIGLRKEQIINKKVTELFPEEPNDPMDWIGKYGQVALTGEPLNFEGYRASLEKWLHVSCYSPKKGYFVSVFEDITERKKAEEALSKAKSQYELLFNSVTEGFANYKIVFDKTGKPDILVLDINPAGAEQSGVKREEQIGKTWRQIWQDIPEEVFDIYRHVYETGKVKTFEHFSPITNAWYIITVGKSAEDQFAVTFFDITERKQADFKLEKFAKQMEQLANERAKELQNSERLAAIGATAGMVGHDIRNPLQAIASDVYLAKSDLSSMPEGEAKESLKESLEGIDKNVEYINKIVQDLQDYARPLNPKIEESDLKQISQDLFAKNGLPENIKIKIEIAENARIIRADKYYLNRILFNLATNAIQAMPTGGVVTISSRRKDDDLIITVTDTGVGIPKSIRDKMFTLMFTTKSKGQGFGLPVVKRMTESLGGTVTFKSQEGKGTTFEIRLPPPKELNGKLVYK